MPVLGTTVRVVWTILDQNGDPLTGMTVLGGDISFRLHRSTSAGTVASGETVSMAEVGSSGTYEISYTPASTGLYTLQLKELNASTNGQQYRFPVDIFAAGSQAVPTFADAFCAETDVERFAQLQFDASSVPSDDDVALFAAGRAKEMQGLLAAAGWTITPATIDADSVEAGILREVNAVGAAGDAWLSKNRDVMPAASEHGRALLDEYELRLTRAVEYARRVLGTNLVGSPMTTGEVTLRDESSIEDSGLSDVVTADQEF